MDGQFVGDTPTWYLDPIDGTTNFANRVPWNSFSLALAFNRTPLVSVVCDPFGVSASRGVGAVIGQYSPIDHLATVLIVHEAGGAVLDEDGNVNLFPESGGIFCATQAASRPPL